VKRLACYCEGWLRIITPPKQRLVAVSVHRPVKMRRVRPLSDAVRSIHSLPCMLQQRSVMERVDLCVRVAAAPHELVVAVLDALRRPGGHPVVKFGLMAALLQDGVFGVSPEAVDVFTVGYDVAMAVSRALPTEDDNVALAGVCDGTRVDIVSQAAERHIVAAGPAAHVEHMVVAAKLADACFAVQVALTLADHRNSSFLLGAMRERVARSLRSPHAPVVEPPGLSRLLTDNVSQMRDPAASLLYDATVALLRVVELAGHRWHCGDDRSLVGIVATMNSFVSFAWTGSNIGRTTLSLMQELLLGHVETVARMCFDDRGHLADADAATRESVAIVLIMLVRVLLGRLGGRGVYEAITSVRHRRCLGDAVCTKVSSALTMSAIVGRLGYPLRACVELCKLCCAMSCMCHWDVAGVLALAPVLMEIAARHPADRHCAKTAANLLLKVYGTGDVGEATKADLRRTTGFRCAVDEVEHDSPCVSYPLALDALAARHRGANSIRFRYCCNPECTNLSGASALTLPVYSCGGCSVWYCSRACQVQRWQRKGHVCRHSPPHTDHALAPPVSRSG
jgi:hypothetical protein